MSKVDIGHAADSQKGLIISKWYDKPWSFCLRAKDPAKAERMAQICTRIIRSGKVKYSQNKRNTLYKALKEAGFDIDKVHGTVYADCSSLMSVCANLAGCGLDLDGVNAPTTRTMRSKFMATGCFDALEDEDVTHSDKGLRVGDILDVPGSHTVMALQNGSGWPFYSVGQTYTTRVNLKVRKGPSIAAAQKLTDDLTADGQRHAFDQLRAVFRAGTKVTVKEVAREGSRTWVRCPSGWLCAVEDGTIYIS